MGAPFDLGKAMGQAWDEGWRRLGEATGFGGTKAPEMRAIDFGQANEARAQQDALLRQLQEQYTAMAAGNGPSLAQGQLQQATDSNIRNAMALGAAQQGQGLGYASALRNIADQSAAARQQAAAQSALIRNAEQMQAMQGLGGIASGFGGMRGQDLGAAGMQADQGYRYDALGAGIDAQNAAARRQLTGGILNAAGSIFSPGGPMTGLASGGAGLQQGGGGATFSGLYNLGGGAPVLGGGFRGQAPQMGDFNQRPLYGSTGGQVPGYARGGALNSTSNDTVPAMLSPGEIVIPRSITMAPDAPERARLFVQAIQQRQKNGPQSDQHHLRRKAA